MGGAHTSWHTDARDIHDVTHIAAADYLRLNQLVMELDDDERCPIGLALSLVYVAQQHDRHSHLHLELVRRQLSWLLSVRELRGLHVGPAMSSIVSALLNSCACSLSNKWLLATEFKLHIWSASWLVFTWNPTNKKSADTHQDFVLILHCTQYGLMAPVLAVPYTGKADTAGSL